MGEINKSFKATIDWVLKFDIIQRIIEGNYGIGDRIVSKPVVVDLKQIENQIQLSKEDEKSRKSAERF